MKGPFSKCALRRLALSVAALGWMVGVACFRQGVSTTDYGERAQIHAEVLSDMIKHLDEDGKLIRFVDLSPKSAGELQRKFVGEFKVVSTNEAEIVPVDPPVGRASLFPIYKIIHKLTGEEGGILQVNVESSSTGQVARARAINSRGNSVVVLQYILKRQAGGWVIESVKLIVAS
jgi:hypothetical protein